MSKPTVSFNGFDLASVVPGLIIVDTDPYRTPNRDLMIGKIANTEKSVTSAAYFRDKKINVLVEIAQNTRELFEAANDKLNAILQTREAPLLLNYSSSNRVWTATWSNSSVTEKHGGWVNMDIEFQCSNPIGSDVNSTSLFSSNRTTSTSTEHFLVGGTAAWQQPILTFTFTTIVGGTGATVTIGNSNTGQQISITRNWLTSDILVIDSQQKIVTVNGTEVTVNGAIPEWAGSPDAQNPSAGSMDYVDTFTSRKVASSGLYFKRYV